MDLIKWIAKGFMRRFWISLFGAAFSFAVIYFIATLGFDGTVEGNEAFAVVLIGMVVGPFLSAIFSKVEDIAAGKDN